MFNFIFSQAQLGPKNCTDPNAKTCSTNLPQIAADQSQLNNILTVIIGALAAIAVLTIVFAAINLITGGGDPDKISRAKKTIIFALIGLAIAILAEAIVLTLLENI